MQESMSSYIKKPTPLTENPASIYGIQEKEREGSRYSAEFIITNSIEKAGIEKALIRSFVDSALDKCVVDNIEVEGKSAIQIIKTYKPNATITAKISAILVSQNFDSLD